MARPEFENQTLISAMTNKSVSVIRRDQNAPLANGTWDQVILFSPPNTVSRVFNMLLEFGPDAGATAGTKTITVDQLRDTQFGIGLFTFTGPFNLRVAWDQGEWKNATVKAPNDFAAMSNQVSLARFDEFKGLSIVFTHNMTYASGNTTTAYRNFDIFVEREVVAR